MASSSSSPPPPGHEKMRSPLLSVKKLFDDAIAKAFPDISVEAICAQSEPVFGDYQCNSAMSLFKKHKSALPEDVKAPRDVGNKILENLQQGNFIESAKVAPQGFVTVRLSSKWLTDEMRATWKYGIRYSTSSSSSSSAAATSSTTSSNEKLPVLVDFSSPNIAKEMHVGHLRSTILGECLSRVFEFCGEDVHRVNHVGDWGTQFGMLIEHLKETCPDFQTSPPLISDLQAFYKESKARFDADPEFKKRSTDMVVKLQKGDKFALAAWSLFCEISRKDFQKIYDRLQITLKECGESFYNDRIPGTVEELVKKGICKEHDGAMMIFTEAGSEAPLIAVKSDGGYGYDSTDLASVRYRLLELKREHIVWVTDAGQSDHFVKLFEVARNAGWTSEKTRLDHVEFGLVQGEDGKKFKTRSGETVKLSDLLDEAISRALKEIKKREGEEDEDEDGGAASSLSSSANKTDGAALPHFLDSDPCPSSEEAAERIGCAAIKYFDLKQNRISDYKFSFDRMLDTKGNTAVYMLYAYARLCQILRKVDMTTINDLDVDRDLDLTSEATHPTERSLAMTLLRFPDVIEAIRADLFPHRLCDFMYELSGKFTDFYKNCRVIGSPEQASRLILCELTRRMLKTSFDLLGISPLQRL